MKNITLATCALVFVTLGFSVYGAANRPNVVIILADDLGKVKGMVLAFLLKLIPLRIDGL